MPQGSFGANCQDEPRLGDCCTDAVVRDTGFDNYYIKSTHFINNICIAEAAITMTILFTHHTLDFLSKVWKYARDKNDATLNGIVETYLQQDDVSDSFIELYDYTGIPQEPVLHGAAANRDNALIEFLLANADVQPYCDSRECSTAVDIAAKRGYFDVIELLMDSRFWESIDPDLFFSTLSQSLVYAIENGQTDVMVQTLDRWPDCISYANGLGLTALNFAALKGDLTVALRLFKYPGIDVHSVDARGNNGLANALHPYLIERFNDGNLGDGFIDLTDEHIEIAKCFLTNPKFNHLHRKVDDEEHYTALECAFRSRVIDDSSYPWSEVLQIFDIEALEAEISQSNHSKFQEFLLNHLKESRSLCVREVLSLRNALVSLIGEDILIRIIVLNCWNRLHGKTEREKIADVMRIFRRFASIRR